MDHFRPMLNDSGVNTELIPDQWTILKTNLYQEPQTLKKSSWCDINSSLQSSCPDILALVDLVLSLPASTAECERGFNVMKQVKTDWRSNLRSETLSDLLLVQLSSPSIQDYNPTCAVELWHQESIRSRRPDFMDKNKMGETESEESSEDD